jgi:hypothetical protein
MTITNQNPSPTFQRAYDRAAGYTVSTPYGTVTISRDGRSIRFDLYQDVRESIHHKALFSYYQNLRKRGIVQINVDHLDIPDLDKSLSIIRGKARLDMVYYYRGKIYEVELETHRQIGLDQTRIQLQELVKHCENLVVVVPRRDMENAYTILTMLNLKDRIAVDSYEILEDELIDDIDHTI